MVRYFCISCTTSGLDYTQNCILTMSVIEISNIKGRYEVDHNRIMRLQFKPEKEVDYKLIGLSQTDIENLREYGVSKKNAIREIKKHLDLKDGETATAVYFDKLDKLFLDQVYYETSTSNPFDTVIIEVSSFVKGEKTDPPYYIQQASEFCEILNSKGDIK